MRPAATHLLRAKRLLDKVRVRVRFYDYTLAARRRYASL